jgi:two-component system, LuxR family, response regulator FixJ
MPACHVRAAYQAAVGPELGAHGLGSRVVALVDDDLAVLESLRLLLELAGYTVAAYSSAAAFLDDHTADPACLISDHRMPRMTGLDLASRLRGEGFGTPILLITGSPSRAIIARAALLGIDVLEKPAHESDIMRFIDAHL